MDTTPAFDAADPDLLATLLEEREQLAQAQRLARVGSWTLGPNFTVTSASAELLRLLDAVDVPVERLLDYFRERLIPEDRSRSFTVFARVARERPDNTEGQWTITHRDGSRRVMYNRTEYIFDSDGALLSGRGTMQDITDRVEAEQRLAHSESRFHSLVQASAQIVWHADVDGMPLDEMESYLAFTGLRPPAGKRARDIWMTAVHPDDREELAATLRFAYQIGRPFDVTHRLLRHDGEWRDVHGRGVPVYGVDGQLREWVGTISDVTDYLRSQEAMRLAESQQLALLQSIPESAWLKGLDGRYITVNSAYAQSIGRSSPTDVAGTHPAEYFPEETVAKFEAQESDVLAKGGTMSFSSEITLSAGMTRSFETTIAPYRDVSGRIAGTVGVARDVTERLLMQERLERSQKMEALGLLSGGIAHDFNNLLSAIIGGAELARMDVANGSQAAEDIDEVRRAALRGAQLTRQLLAFSRQQVVKTRVIDLGGLVRDAEPLLRRLLPERIVLDLVTLPACVVRGDASQLEQILLNLVVNARDALAATSQVPVITVETARVTLAAGDKRLERVDHSSMSPGDYVTLSVRDTGGGMDEATRRRIFEPFFTTKRVGEGTGLGLATVANVVQRRGGTVYVESAPGAGALFTVLLPFCVEQPDRVMVGHATLPTGTETVLLVEDETVVRVTARRILERNGYTVLEARHGNDALLTWAQDPDRIAAVLTDLRMPELGGRALATQMRAERPGLPIVFMSGYAADEELPDEGLLASTVFLAKPFSSESLLVCVREAIDRLART